MTDRIVDEALMERARRHAIEYLGNLDKRPVGARATHEDLLRKLGRSLTAAGEGADAVIDSLADAGREGTMATAGPRFFGFVIGGTLPVALAADWLVSAWDQNAGLYVASPVASVAEEVAREWLLDLLDLPRESAIGFVTGCQMANFTCLAAARNAVLRHRGWDVEQKGLNSGPPITIVASAESHVTIHTSARMLGLGLQSVRAVETDSQGRMVPSRLEEALRTIEGSVIVSAQAGNVNTGAVDPLAEIAAIAHGAGAWLHVDGAFGLWGRASRTRKPLLAGVESADSWATDGHKWLNVPYDCGIAIVRDPLSLRAAMTVSAAYLEQTSGVERDELDWVPEFSRRARGVPVYAALRTLGLDGVERLVDAACDQALRFVDRLSGDHRVTILNEVVLNQVLVRFGDSDALTRDVIARVQREGTCWLAGTTWHDMAAMRISISSWATTDEDVDRSAEAILRCLDAASD